MTIIKSKIFFALWINVGWFGCVYFGKFGWGIASLVFPAVAWGLMHQLYPLTRTILTRIMILLLIGLTFDSTAAHFNLIIMNPPAEWGWLPIWLTALWLLFITSLPLLQGLFQKKYFIAALIGAVFGPLSYRAGTQFGTLTMSGYTALFIYAIFWAVYTPCAIMWLNRRDTSYENQ